MLARKRTPWEKVERERSLSLEGKAVLPEAHRKVMNSLESTGRGLGASRGEVRLGWKMGR